jgi:shikimate kinase
MTPRVVLVGLPGSGKSTTGRRLATMLGVAFADSDDLVERETGRSVAELFAAGESEFRDAEALAIDGALRDFDGVLALGGGALGRAETRRRLLAAGTPVVLLRARVEQLLARVGDGRTRPLLHGAPAERLRELAAEREPHYAECASATVVTDGRTPGQVAVEIVALLRQPSGSR